MLIVYCFMKKVKGSYQHNTYRQDSLKELTTKRLATSRTTWHQLVTQKRDHLILSQHTLVKHSKH